MGKYPSGPTLCSEDSSCHVLILSLTNWGPVLVFAFWGYVLVTLVAFQFYRRVQTLKRSLEPVVYNDGPGLSELHAGPALSKFKTSSNELKTNKDTCLDMDDNRDLQITGYVHTAFGEFCYILCCLVSLHWLALFILILFDTYNQCEVGGIDNLCFYGNHVIFGAYNFNAVVSFVSIPSDVAELIGVYSNSICLGFWHRYSLSYGGLQPYGLQVGWSTVIKFAIGFACHVIYLKLMLLMFGRWTKERFSLLMFPMSSK